MSPSLKKDLLVITIIGAYVGLLSQVILTNIMPDLLGHVPFSPSTLRILVFFLFLIGAPLALLIFHVIGKSIPVLYQFAKFVAVGVSNSFVDTGILSGEVLLTGIANGPNYKILAAISFLCGTTNSFFWNKYWTFNAGGEAKAGETLKFYVIAIVGGILNVSIATYVVNNVSHANISNQTWATVGKVIGIAFTFMWNFIGYKFLVFKNGR